MKAFTRRQDNYLICQIALGFIVWTNCADGSCSKAAKKLWAYPNPTTETFADSYKGFISSDRGERCQWVITASDQNSNIRLRFSNFQLKNTTSSRKGDCLEIYYGDDGDTLDVLCDQYPKDTYVSSDGEMTVIYKRGEVEGDRRFSMVYSTQSVVSKENLIQIAGIVGAILAGIGVTYFVLRTTKCFKCLRKKNNTDNSGNPGRERDRLMQTAAPGGENAAGLPQTLPSSNSTTSPRHNLNAVMTAETTVTIGDHTHDSDIDSLQDMNELPPSYESLYLNELGESATPPKYSPPEHISTHAPRRVNTVN
ncbi:hypothetical protein BsWGS_14145 [Bradybaena similaris]